MADYLDTTHQRYPKLGDKVNVIQKKHYGSGRLTCGTVKDILTKKRYHPRGHKVRLENGVIGRVQSFLEDVSKDKPVAAKPREPKLRIDPNELR